MQLTIVGTGSKGNSYILKATNGDVLLIEAGVKFLNIKEKLDFDLSKVCGLLISHFHLDHCKGAEDACKAGINIYTSKESKENFRFKSNRVKVIEEEKSFCIGSFRVLPFAVSHDVYCFGFLIEHKEMGKTLFITDTFMVHHKFKNLNNIIIEANYSMEILEDLSSKGLIHDFLHDRVIKSHLSLENCKGVLIANELSKVYQIVLIHLSERNSNAVQFQKEIEELTGKKVTVATNGMVMDFNETPF